MKNLVHELSEYKISEQQHMKLELYQKFLLQWNEKTDLISKHDYKDIYSRHILNCLNILHLIKPSDYIIHDVGSGAGLPGLICRICDDNPKRQYFLFEKKYQKRSFLKNMIISLELDNVFVCEKYPDVSRETCDVLTSRALLSLNDIVKYEPYYKKFILFKGENYLDEINFLNSTSIKDSIKVYKILSDDSYLLVGEKNGCFT